jgi:hypothetical protein
MDDQIAMGKRFGGKDGEVYPHCEMQGLFFY